jgi:uncharacterized protein YpmS
MKLTDGTTINARRSSYEVPDFVQFEPKTEYVNNC